jgi:integrase
VHKLVRNALGDALRMELVTRNVATQVKAPSMARQRRPELGVAEARQFLEVIEGKRLEAFYVLALTTGLRRGELLALRWDDIDLGSRQLHVRRALQRVGGKPQMVKPKTGSSMRTVVLPKLAVRYLRDHKKRQAAERLAFGDAWREHGLVFVSSTGTPIEPRNVNRRWDELRVRAGLDWLRRHDLRHGCASRESSPGGTACLRVRGCRPAACRDRRATAPGAPRVWRQLAAPKADAHVGLLDI